MVHFTYTVIHDGYVFVDANRDTAAKTAKRLLSRLDEKQIARLGLFRTNKYKVGRVQRASVVRKALDGCG